MWADLTEVMGHEPPAPSALQLHCPPAIAMESVISAIPSELLERHFGYKSFRPQQREIIEHVLAGNDAVVLMPTGGGKSLCFQIPAMALDGLTVVVSPLIALMKDQVQALQANGIAAAFINSSLNLNEEREIDERLENGEIKLLYLSPERLFAPNVLEWLARLNVKLFAIDEAHCISSWGHSFRPEYKKLNTIKRRFPQVPVIALTATADRAVRGDIAQHLGMRNERMFVSSFDRPNLSLAVLPGVDRWKAIERIMSRHAGKCGIIYCGSRDATEKLAAKLQKVGVRADYYHAGRSAEDRNEVQDEFISGKLHVICATIAFGMGIDKSDVRFVIHYNLPGNLESYYQEIGRAGRDGQPSETILFYSYADVQGQMYHIEKVEDPQYKKILIAKLDRMKEYAEAQVCRRTILLSYFSETTAEPCGNCDVCKDPPKYFSGTLLAQKALSAVVRCKELLSMSVLIDVLKGTRSTEVVENRFDTVKTFGAGGDVSAFGWMMFLQQMIQYGLFEIDYKAHYHLKVTDAGHSVLRGEREVRLVTPDTIKERQERTKKQAAAPATAPSSGASADLLQRLKDLRKAIAKEITKPAYIVFSDATLVDMAEKRPTNVYEFRLVSGVGDHKVKQYAERFLAEVAKG